MNFKLRSLIGIFTIKDGNISLLLDKNSLIYLDVDDDIENINNKFLNNALKNKLSLKQGYTFCEKKDNNMIISILYYGIINYEDIVNYDVVSLDKLNKNKYIDKLIECLKLELSHFSVIKKLYPNEFKLPDIQKLYELVLNKKFDRRNFRKRLLRLGIIEDLQRYSLNKTGRPAKLYRFNELTEDKILF